MHACLWKLWDENLDDINTTITCHWNKIHNVANYSLFLAKELDDLKRPPECMKQVKCDDGKCVGSISLMKSDPKCSLYLDHDSALHHMVAVRPLSPRRLCPTTIKYDPCKFVDQKPPDVSLTILNATKVRVNISLPKCTAEAWKNGKATYFWYFVTYWKSTQGETTSNTRQAKGKHNTTVDLDLGEASLYYIRVTYSNYIHDEGPVLHSKYAQVRHLTAPVTALDEKPFRPFVDATCLPSHAGQGQKLLLSWKKSGIIEEYLVSLNITNKFTKREIIETKTTNNYITVKNDVPGESVINITVKSSNRAGISLPESQIIDFDVCAIPKSFVIKECGIKKIRKNAAFLYWKVSVKKPDNYLVNVKDTNKNSSKDIFVNSNSFENLIKNETVSYLEDCAVYQISIYSQVYGQLVNPCQLKYMQLKSSVQIEFSEVFGNSTKVLITDQKLCFQSGYEYFYKEINEQENKKRITQVTSKYFTINDLKPNTTYQLKIRQNYMNIQQGNYTVYNFTTKISAPEDAPVFYFNKTNRENLYKISWYAHVKNNRKASLYKMKITNNNLRNDFKGENCTKKDNSTTLCFFYQPTYRSYFNLSDTAGVQLSACNTDGNKVLCSKWSEFKLAPRDYNVGLQEAVWIISLTLPVGLMLFLCFKTRRETRGNVEPKISSEVMESIRFTQLERNQHKCQPTNENIETLDEWRENLKKKEIEPAADQKPPSYVIASEIPSVKTAEFLDLMTSSEYRRFDDVIDGNDSDYVRRTGERVSDDDDFRLMRRDERNDKKEVRTPGVAVLQPTDCYLKSFDQLGGSGEEKELLINDVNAYVGEDVFR